MRLHYLPKAKRQYRPPPFVNEVRRCAHCGKKFRPRRAPVLARHCGRQCANLSLARREHLKALARRPTCARPGCGKKFRKRNRGHKYCSLECSSTLSAKPMTAAPQAMRDNSADRGEPTCPQHPAEPLAFGSHPLSGMSMEYCPKCGWRPLQRRLSA